jgi:hypothetical protein
MNKFKNVLLNTDSIKQGAKNQMRRFRLAVQTAIVGLMLIFTVQAQNPTPFNFNLAPASDTIANCLPNASASVTVFPKEDFRGVDTLDLKAQGLPANTSFAVFLTESAVGSVGAVQYIGEFTTNSAGRGSLRVDTVIEEAFSSTVVEGVRVRKELNHMVIWFADPEGDELCVPGSGPSPFDGDGQAGAQVLSTRNILGVPIP